MIESGNNLYWIYIPCFCFALFQLSSNFLFFSSGINFQAICYYVRLALFDIICFCFFTIIKFSVNICDVTIFLSLLILSNRFILWRKENLIFLYTSFLMDWKKSARLFFPYSFLFLLFPPFAECNCF